MNRRFLCIILALVMALSICCVGIISTAAADNTATIKVGGQSYTVKVGDLVEYNIAFSYTGSKLATAQVELPVDFTALSGYSQDEINANLKRVAPTTANSSVVLRSDGDNTLGLTGYIMNFVSPSGYSFSTKKVMLSLVFGVEKAGSYELSSKVRYVDDVNDKTIVDGNYIKQDNRFQYSESLTEATLDTPQIKVATDAGGMKISWNPVPRATLYRVYYKSASGWTKIMDTTETSVLHTNVESGKRYTYTVRCLSADGTRFLSDYDHEGKSAIYYTAPKLTLSNNAESVSIKWNSVAQASKYRLYYKTASGWTKIADTASTSYTHTGVTSGTTYTYTVRCMDSKGNHISWYYPDGFSIQFIKAPKLTLSNAADGVSIKWDAVPQAAKYRLYYKTASGWTTITDTASTSYTHTGLTSNTTYTYTLRCMDSNNKHISWYYPDGFKIKFVGAPKLTLSNNAESVSIKWNAVAGASKYRLYYKTASGWTKIVDSASTSYTHTGVTSGTTYTYTVRCMDSKGNHISWYYPDGFSIQFIKAPKLTLSNAADGVSIKWDAVPQAAKYRLYYKTASGWTTITDTASTSYTHTGLTSNTTYTYTLRCMDSNNNHISWYYPDGFKIKFVGAPKLTLSNNAESVSIKWNAVAGASKYRLYYKTESGWTKIVDTASTSYTHTGVTSGTTYTYTVRCMDSKGNHISWYYPDGFSIQFIKAPKLTLSNAADGVSIKWDAVPQAAKYRLYYKTASGWTTITDTASTSYTHTGLTSNTTYTYTLRCMDNNGNHISWYYPDGFNITYSK